MLKLFIKNLKTLSSCDEFIRQNQAIDSESYKRNGFYMMGNIARWWVNATPEVNLMIPSFSTLIKIWIKKLFFYQNENQSYNVGNKECKVSLLWTLNRYWLAFQILHGYDIRIHRAKKFIQEGELWMNFWYIWMNMISQ